MQIGQLLKVFDSDTHIKIENMSATLYFGFLKDAIEFKHSNLNVAWCEVTNNTLYIMVEQ